MPKKIGEILVESGLLTEQQVKQGLDAQKFYGGRVGSLWLELDMLEEGALLKALCDQKKAEPARASALKNIAKSTLDLIPVKVAVRYQAIPLQRDNRRLTVALADPNDLLALDELAFITGCVVEPLLATERTLLNALEKYYGVPRERQGLRVEGAKVVKAPAPEPTEPPPTPVPQEESQPLVLDDAEAQAARQFWSAGDGENEPAAPAKGDPPLTAVVLGSETAPSDAATTQGIDDGEQTAILAEEQPRTLEEAARRLARIDIRDDIADVILWCTEGLVRRSALFIFQKNRTLGWTGQGEGLEPRHVRQVVQPIDEVSIFTLVRDSQRHYLGELPKNPANEKIATTLFGEGEWPEAVLVIPFGIKGRAIGCYLAEDDRGELEQIELNMLFRLLQKAGLALELMLVRSKIITV